MNCPYQEPPTPAPTTAAPIPRRPHPPTRRRRLSRPRSPPAPVPESTYAPTHEPTEVPPTPRPTVISTYAPTVAETAPAEVATFNCTAYDGALLRIEDRDLTLRMEDGRFEPRVGAPGRRHRGVALHTEGDEEDADDRAAYLRRVRDKLCEFDARGKALSRFVRVRARRRDDC